MGERRLADEQAERAVLGALLAGHEFEMDLQADDMALPVHAVVLGAALAVRRGGHKVNHLSVSQQLQNQSREGKTDLERVGGPTFLMGLDENGRFLELRSAGLEDQARRLRDLALRRRASAALHRISDALWDLDRPASDAVLAGSGELARLAGGGLASWVTGGEAIREQLDLIEKIQGGDKRAVQFVPTGFEALDEAQGGALLGELTLVAAHPNNGKSAFLASAAWHMAERGEKCAIFQLEGHRKGPARRWLANVVGYEARQLFRPGLTAEELERVWERPAKLFPWIDNIFIDDVHHQSARQVVAKMRQAHARHGVRVFMVDHLLEMLDLSEAANTARDLAVGALMQEQRDFADEAQVAILNAIHLKDPQEQRIDARFVRPKMQDLIGGRFTDRMAGAIWALWSCPLPKDPEPPKFPPEPKAPAPKQKPQARRAQQPLLDGAAETVAADKEAEEERERTLDAWRQKKLAAEGEYARKVRDWEEKVERAKDTLMCSVLKSREGGPAGQEFELRRIRHAGLIARKSE